MSYSVLTLLQEEGMQLEYVQAVVTAEQLARGVDLLRTNGNKITLIGGLTVEDQVWKSVRLSSDDPSIRVVISAGPCVVGEFSVDTVTGSLARQRITKVRLVKAGTARTRHRAVRLTGRLRASHAGVLRVVRL